MELNWLEMLVELKEINGIDVNINVVCAILSLWIIDKCESILRRNIHYNMMNTADNTVERRLSLRDSIVIYVILR